MSQRQIIADGRRIGFLPWSGGVRLGAPRWTGLESHELTHSDSIQVVDTSQPEIPLIETTFRNEAEYNLPESTKGGTFRLCKEIRWSILTKNDCFIQHNVLTVIGDENEEFTLVAEVGDYTKEYQCKIEQKETILLDPFVVKVKPSPINLLTGVCELICNTQEEYLQDYRIEEAQSAELILSGVKFEAETKLIKDHWSLKTNSVVRFGSKFHIPLCICLQGMSSDCRLSWITKSYRFETKISLDYSLLNIDCITPVCHFEPRPKYGNKLNFTDIFSNESLDEALGHLDINLAEMKLNGLPVELKVETPIEKRTVPVNVAHMSWPVKRRKLYDWFKSESSNVTLEQNVREIIVTPVIDGHEINDLASKVRVEMDITRCPAIGLVGQKEQDWKEFLLRSPAEVSTIHAQNGIHIPMSDQSWFEQLDSSRKEAIIRNSVFRAISLSTIENKELICPQTNGLIEETFDYGCDDKIGVNFENHKRLRESYGGKKIVEVDSHEIHILYPGQQFELRSDETSLALNHPYGHVHFPEGPRLPICKSRGIFFEANEEIYSTRKIEAFAYKENNSTFTAPTKPGVYYLHLVSNQENIVIEIEVHGFRSEVVE